MFGPGSCAKGGQGFTLLRWKGRSPTASRMVVPGSATRRRSDRLTQTTCARQVPEVVVAGHEAHAVIDAHLSNQHVRESSATAACDHLRSREPARSQKPVSGSSTGSWRSRVATGRGSFGSLKGSVTTTGGRQAWWSASALSTSAVSSPDGSRSEKKAIPEPGSTDPLAIGEGATRLPAGPAPGRRRPSPGRPSRRRLPFGPTSPK